MDTALKIARLTVLLSVAFACGMLGIACMQARTEMISVSGKAGAAIDEMQFGAVRSRLNTSLDNLDRQIATVGPVAKKAGPALDNLTSDTAKLGDAIDLTSHRVNDLCPTANAVDAAIHPCGTLADTNRTLATLRGTSGQVEMSLRVFNQHEGDLFIQESAAYAAMDKSVLDFDAAVSNKDIATSVHNFATVSGNFATMTADGKDWLHAKLYPTKKKGFVNGLDATGDVLHHFEPSIF